MSLKLKRICFHHTGGSYGIEDPKKKGKYTPNQTDWLAYHATVGPDKIVTLGKYKPEDNIPPLTPKQYAPHCGGGNSYTIGVAFRCNHLFTVADPTYTPYPLTRAMFEAGVQWAAGQCIKYGIPVTPDTVYTHYEFGIKNPKTASRGKIDITYLPWEPHIKPGDVGDYFRDKVQWYVNQGNTK